MTTPPFDNHRAWVREYLEPRYPDLVADYLDAFAIYVVAKSRCALDRSDIERLVQHSRSPRTPLGEGAAAMLGDLLAPIPEIGPAIRALATGRHAHERVNALVALHSAPPTELHSELFARLLCDKSARVRALAADKIVHHQITSLESELKAAILRETNVEVASELQADIDYLRQRFHVQPSGENLWITCRPSHGGSISKLFTPAEYEATGSLWINEQLNHAPNEA